MKKILIVTFISLLALNANAQKKKTTKTTKPKNEILAKVDNLSAEIVPVGKGKKLLVFVKNETSTDTLVVKVTEDANLKPTEFILKSFTASGSKLYLLSWKEQVTTETKLKKEVADITENQIWNPTTKTLLLGNTQKSIYIKETVFLDNNKSASHEVEKKRGEGYEFVLNTDGSVALKTKIQDNNYKYNSATDKFEAQKPTIKSTTKKKK